MRVYISGKITGTADYKERFAKAELTLKATGCDVVNPVKVGEELPGLSYQAIMRVDLHLLDQCDAIYMLKGWETSPGANREYGYALAKDYLIVCEDGGAGG